MNFSVLGGGMGYTVLQSNLIFLQLVIWNENQKKSLFIRIMFIFLMKKKFEKKAIRNMKTEKNILKSDFSYFVSYYCISFHQHFSIYYMTAEVNLNLFHMCTYISFFQRFKWKTFLFMQECILQMKMWNYLKCYVLRTILKMGCMNRKTAFGST